MPARGCSSRGMSSDVITRTFRYPRTGAVANVKIVAKSIIGVRLLVNKLSPITFNTPNAMTVTQ